MAADWNIQIRSPQCCGCNTPFTEGMVGFSLLLPDEAGKSYQRRDYCKVCHEARESKEHMSAWRFVVQSAQPTEQKEEPLHRDTASELLKKLMARALPEDIGLICLLAALLERSKLLIEREVTFTPEGTRQRLYEERATGAFYTILDPGLTDDVGPLQERIIHLLDHGLEETR